MKNFKKLLLSALCVLATVAVNGCKNSGQEAPAAPAQTSQNNSDNAAKTNNATAASLTEQIGDNSYKVVKINGKIWMAENLRSEHISHYSANGDSSNDAKYGYLYTWENAKKACPEPWHLPTKDDFEQMLLATSEMQKHFDNGNSYYSSKIRATNWENGTNTSGFGALPAGDRGNDGNYTLFGSYASFWSGSPSGDESAYRLRVLSDDAYVYYDRRDTAYSVRCLRDIN